MAIVFPCLGNPRFPLPPDFDDLTLDGKRLARVNAVSIGGDPELEVASWRFFREYYLAPEESGWFRDGFVKSPPSHEQWVRDWYTHLSLIHIAPRGGCKTTINLEDMLRNFVSRRFWECAMFLATREFCTDRLGRIAFQIENNQRIIDDFGKLKPRKGAGTWNRGSVLESTVGSKITAKPIKGASLGTRPSGLIVLDDVEKSQEQTINPSDLRQGFHDFFFNGILPMARNPKMRVPLRVVGTLYSRMMFIHYLYTTKDPKVADIFHRTMMDVYQMDWPEAMGPEWIEEERKRLGNAAFSAQCLNKPVTDDACLLKMHPDLNTYYLEARDQVVSTRPFESNAKIVTHQVTKMENTTEADGTSRLIPRTRKLVRPFADVVAGMYRFITVDYAETINEMSDYSVAHVLGLESSDEHPNTLYSLDAYLGKCQRSELVDRIVELALKWNVHVIGIEWVGVLNELYERIYHDTESVLKAKISDGRSHIMPAIIPLKFPTAMSKGEKIKGMAWRFEQFRVKIPSDRGDEMAYQQLWNQINLFTSDLGLLEHDDILDTLAMHQAIGKSIAPRDVSIVAEDDPIAALKRGEIHNTETGESHLHDVIASGKMTGRLWDELEARRADETDNESSGYEYQQDWPMGY